ncbi:MAG TPA: MarR family transcriptional regulator [Acidimicrobiales bacterium]|jgi:DNA-binding MarR family transcriptional regulator
MAIEGNGKRRPSTDTTLELAERLTHSARRLRLGSTAQLAPLGITNAQARVLRIVASSAQPIKMADIAARLEVVPRSVTTMVDGVEAAGLIVRSTDPDDRRSVLVSLTARGHALLERLERARRITAEEIFGGLSGTERAELARLLASLCRHGHCRCGASPHTEFPRTARGRRGTTAPTEMRRSRAHEDEG